MADSQNTPPGNPFESQDGMPDGQQQSVDAVAEELPQGAPNVAAKAGKTLLVAGLLGAGVLFLLYSIIFGGEKEEKVVQPKKVTVAPKPIEPPPLPVAEPEPEIPLPPITAPGLPEPLDIPGVGDGRAGGGFGNTGFDGELSGSPLTPEQDEAAKAAAQARLKSNMLIKDGGSGAVGGIGSILGGSNPTAQNANEQFALNAAATKVETVAATRMQGDLRRTIGQGRIIQATMETALNTDLSAPIRAIVSRDTYGEAGNIPLIPKGSRLIGSYNTVLTSGQTRVLVIWTRVIRPDGVDVMLGSPLVDGIGQAGVTGQIDTKFQEIFSRALVSSVMNIALAIGSDEITGGTTTTTNSDQGGSQTSGDAATTATTNALNRLGAVTDGFIQRFLNVPPTILVDQGTPVNVFVNKDIVFPGNTATGARLLE
jgi:type IV secretion system protein VirB10